ncbi:MAG: transcriptional repressor [Bacteroidota bacterium]
MENVAHLRNILESHSLRITDCRKNVLQFFLNRESALSQSDLENAFTQYDRVTLYRTLNSFLASGIIHKIPNSRGVATYGLCRDTCSPNHHDDNHIHFKCNHCGEIQCLDDQLIPEVTMPKGYLMETVNMIVDGVCAKCS